MSLSTWHNTLNGMYTATHDAYMAKTARQRAKGEVKAVMVDINAFCQRKQQELQTGEYKVGPYRHIDILDTKKPRHASVLPYEDRCVQNSVKDAFEPLVLRQMTDDMMGGLPGCGILASDRRHQVVAQMKRAMNNRHWRYMMQGDITKFYDNVDNVLTMQLIERQVKDRRTLAVIRQHLFNQKRLAIGDPFSHLLANLNMSVIVRKAKAKYGRSIQLINFADDLMAFAHDKETLKALRRDLHRWARQQRLKFKRMYIREIEREQLATFCGYRYQRGVTLLTQRTKKRYVKSRHRRRSMGSYQGIIQVADTKRLRFLIETNDNRHMTEKIRRPFAGRPMKIETMEGIRHTVVDFQKKISNQKDCESYYHVQAIADGLGLIVYSTGATKICKYLDGKTRNDIPLRDMTIVHDWSGYYYDGTVYTDAEEETMIRQQFNIPK